MAYFLSAVVEAFVAVVRPKSCVNGEYNAAGIIIRVRPWIGEIRASVCRVIERCVFKEHTFAKDEFVESSADNEEHCQYFTHCRDYLQRRDDFS